MLARHPRALLAFPPGGTRRFTEFRWGLNRAGYEVVQTRHFEGRLEPDDLLVTWNSGGHQSHWENMAREVGCCQLVAENAYVRADECGREYYAISVGGHNGSGSFPLDDGERWRQMLLPVKPWQTQGDWIVVATQRGLGAAGMRMPRAWPGDVVAELQELTRRHVEVRLPPSRMSGQMRLDLLLQRAWLVVVWTSNVATQALLAGVPAVYAGRAHICSPAMQQGLGDPDRPLRGDREAAFSRMACAQWTRKEVLHGEAFIKLHEHWRATR